MASQAQIAQRAIFRAVSARWNTVLTEQQRTAWNNWTNNYPRQDQLRQVYTPSGAARHAGCNAISYAYANAFIDNPPVDQHCHQPHQVTITLATASPQALDILICATLDPDEYWVLAATPLTNPGFYNCNRLWRPLAFGQNTSPYTYNAITPYLAKFQALRTGYKINAKLQVANVTTGVISTPLTTSTIID